MKLNKDMTVMEVLEYCDQQAAVEVLQSYGMHCLGCAIAHGETIEQAALVHGNDPDELIRELEKHLIAD